MTNIFVRSLLPEEGLASQKWRETERENVPEGEGLCEQTENT